MVYTRSQKRNREDDDSLRVDENYHNVSLTKKKRKNH
jgi:hypothetical protein